MIQHVTFGPTGHLSETIHPPDRFGRIPSVTHGLALSLRPLAPADAPELIRIRRTPAVARWWGEPEPRFPLGDDAQAVRWTIEIDDVVAGMVQYSEETQPRYRHAALDIFIDPAWHNRGVGSEVLRRVVQHLVTSLGHHRVTIDPAVMNAPAIRAYEKAGFRAVGVMRAYERDAVGDAWHDGLLMEFVAGQEEAADALKQDGAVRATLGRGASLAAAACSGNLSVVPRADHSRGRW